MLAAFRAHYRAGKPFAWAAAAVLMSAGLTGTAWLTGPDLASAQTMPIACPAPVMSGGTATVTCGYTGRAQTWTVPAGVSGATFDVFGAHGGSSNSSAGGKGAEVTARLDVTAGQTFEIVVGGAGAPFSGGPGGFNGGGAGGTGVSGVDFGTGGAGGGGASDIRTGLCAPTGGCGPVNRLLVAAGGGGSVAAGGAFTGAGGFGGYPAGEVGDSEGTDQDGGAGDGGNQSAGGAGGMPGSGRGCPARGGASGSLDTGGAGGNGRPAPSISSQGGGGGGGGYYGGGGGSGSCDGGFGGAGGGGSSFAAPGTAIFHNGVRTGNGEVVITYQPSSLTGEEDAGAQLADLDQAVAGVGPNDVLASTVAQAQSSLASGQMAVTCAILRAFTSEVRAFSPWLISTVQANQLIADARQIESALSC